MKALVTGATGFIGGNLARALLARGHQVRALVRKGSNTRNVEGLDVEMVDGDLADASQDDLCAAMEGCEAVFHSAALYSFWTPDEKAVWDINVTATGRLFDAASRSHVKRVVFTSSETTVGIDRDGLGREHVAISPRELHGSYKRSKLAAENLAFEMCRDRMLPIVVVNPTMPIGPHDVKPTPTGQVIVDYLNHKMPAYVNTGMNVVDVEDVAVGHVLALENGRVGHRYILGGRNLTFKEMLGILEELTGIRAPVIRIPQWIALCAGHADEFVTGRVLGRRPRIPVAAVRAASRLRYHDCSKAVVELGMPQSPVEEAFAKAVRWFRENGYVNQGSMHRLRIS